MSVLHPDTAKLLREMPDNLRHELSRLDARGSMEDTARATAKWLSSTRLSAELLKVIDAQGQLTPLGVAVIQEINGKTTPVYGGPSARQVIDSDFVEEDTLATLAHLDYRKTVHTLAIAALPELERTVLERLGVIDADWNLTRLGEEVVRDLKWQRRR